jgi:hypothetical protein
MSINAGMKIMIPTNAKTNIESRHDPSMFKRLTPTTGIVAVPMRPPIDWMPVAFALVDCGNLVARAGKALG